MIVQPEGPAHVTIEHIDRVRVLFHDERWFEQSSRTVIERIAHCVGPVVTDSVLEPPPVHKAHLVNIGSTCEHIEEAIECGVISVSHQCEFGNREVR